MLGTRHCFNGIADSADDFLSLREMDDGRRARSRGADGHGRGRHELRPAVPVSRSAGLRAAQSRLTAAHLRRRRLRHRHARLGRQNGNLATAVSALEIVTAGGDVLSIAREQGSRDVPGGGRQSRRARRRHQGHAGRAAGVHDAAGRVPGPADGAGPESTSKTSSRPATASACSPIGSGDGSTKSG